MRAGRRPGAGVRPRVTCRRCFAGVLIAVATSTCAAAAPDAQAPPAPREANEDEKPEVSIDVRGLGWWRDRELRARVRLLEPEGGWGAVLDTALVEDAVVLLQSTLLADGYLRPAGKVILKSGREKLGTFPWSGGEVPALPRDLAADRATIRLEPGVRYTFDELQFSGLSVLKPDEARAYFVEEGFLLGGDGLRKFSPGMLNRGVRNLQDALVQRGYADARVTVEREHRDLRTGEVDVVLAITEGRRHRVRAVTFPPDAVPDDVLPALNKLTAAAPDVPFTPRWQQEFLQKARHALYSRGFAEASVALEDQHAPGEEEDVIWHSLRLVVKAGPKVRIGTIHFLGEGATRESLLRRIACAEPGDLFDQGKIDQDRIALGALGIFRSVKTEVRKPEPSIWDLTYLFEPGDRFEAGVLLGYGSYEKIRGGLELTHANTFGRGHRGRLQFIVSQKSTSSDYLYTVPRVFGSGVDVSARVFGLQREEVSFDREEYGVSVGARRRVGWYGGDAALRYQFESVNSDIFDRGGSEDAPTDSTVASLTLDLTRDKLDNPVLPRRGSMVTLAFETAAQALGSEVDYQRLEARAAWHRPVGRGRYLHVALRHGIIYSLDGPAAEEIPLARRFFPGGESTLRGYVEGRASPRREDGTVIGAEVSTIFNVEYEQSIARNLAAILFVDTGLTAESLDDFPGDETRVSVGLGLRYDTPIGPVRLEYGHNVVREEGDGRDAWHLALGYPF